MTAKETRKKFGIAGGPLKGTKVLGRKMGHDFTMASFCILVLNAVAGTATGANVYGGNLGKGYDPSHYTGPLHAEGSEGHKKWDHKGYEEWTQEETEANCPGIVEFIEVKAPKAKTSKPKAETAAKS